MTCPKCGSEQTEQSKECITCGIVFEKYLQRRAPEPRAGALPRELALEPEATGAWELLRSLALYVEPDTNPLVLGGRVAFFSVIVLWGVKFIFTPMESNYAGRSFWHLVNLPFHEAGHIIFSPFGRFLTSLGGSLSQLAIPLICLFSFLLKTRDSFAASFCLWWFGESFMDLAPYINDARSLTMPLLGGISLLGTEPWKQFLRNANFRNPLPYHFVQF